MMDNDIIKNAPKYVGWANGSTEAIEFCEEETVGESGKEVIDAISDELVPSDEKAYIFVYKLVSITEVGYRKNIRTTVISEVSK